MSFEHIPEEKGRKKNPKTVADTRVKLNFPHTNTINLTKLVS